MPNEMKRNQAKYSDHINEELMRIVLNDGYYSSVAGFVLAVALCAMNTAVIESHILFGWLAAITANCSIRLGATWSCKKKLAEGALIKNLPCIKLYLAMVYCTGIIWGLAPISLFPPHSVPHQMVLIFILAGLSAGAVPILAPLIKVYFIYIAFPLTSLAVVLFLQHQRLYYGMSLLVVFFFMVLVKSSKSMEKSLVTTLETRFKNETLISSLEAARFSAEAAATAKNNFLANMSHEIRTPMNGILGTLQLLKESELGKTQQDYVGMAYSSAESLLRLLNDILDFSRIEAGKLKLEHVIFDLQELVDELELLLSTQLREKAISFQVIVDSNNPALLVGDPFRVRQILINYLTNAIKFTDEGKITLNIRTVEASKETVRIRLEVEDTGIGISRGDRQRLFRSFTQADSSMTRKYGGSGLGLAIVRQLVDLMGGSCGAQSELGKGSCFWCEIPFGLVALAQEIPERNSSKKLESPPRLQGRVLLVEDNPVNQMIAYSMLKKIGLGGEVAGNGQEALELLAKEQFDAVLMDCQMPVLDGYNATRELRKLELQNNQARMPVIAMTAHAMDGDRAKCLEAGMDDYLAKPVKIEDLVKTLERWFNRAEQSSNTE